MAKRYYNDYNYEKKEKVESKIFSKPSIIEEVEKNEPPKTETIAAAPASTEKIVKVYCNVRKEPNGEIVKTYQVGTAVKVVKEVEGWSLLEEGLYIRSDLLG